MTVQSLVELVTSFVKEQIITGKLQPHQQVKEEEVASKFDISRPPVREAFSRLEAEGLVVKKPRKGVFVTEPTMDDVREIYKLKASLYELSTELAMQVMTEGDVLELERLIQSMNEHTRQMEFDILGYQSVHIQFHRKIMLLAGNKRLLNFAENLHNQVCRFSYKALQYREHIQYSMVYHNDILQAIQARDQKRACQLTKDHVLDALDFQYRLYCSEQSCADLVADASHI
ncbi:MAG: GntR family transcriptional regulator [Desulfovermiculus sp.]